MGDVVDLFTRQPLDEDTVPTSTEVELLRLLCEATEALLNAQSLIAVGRLIPPADEDA